MHDDLMRAAIDLAVRNVRSGKGGPFAALVVQDTRIVGEGTNCVTSSNDPTAHAEINAIRSACTEVQSYRLIGCDLYTTCEPCPMCLGAIYWARIARVYYAATQDDARAAGFDDWHIYEEMARPIPDRRIDMIRTLPEYGTKAFEAWAEQSDRVPY